MKPHEGEPVDIGQLLDEIHELERRVEALEHHTVHVPMAAAMPLQEAPFAGTGLALSNPVPVAGRAVLGLAGAYLLRALAEGGSVPRLLVVTAAILYAATWLLLGVRSRGKQGIAAATYGITAALILAPLLWEATVSFQVLPPVATAAVLVAFAGLVCWRDQGIVAYVTTSAAVLTALALMIRTGSLLPFAAALLGIACVVEIRVVEIRVEALRGPVAAAADFAVWLVLFLTSRRGGVPEGYEGVGPMAAAGLFAMLAVIYAGSLVWRTVTLRKDAGVFGTLQCGVACFIAIAGILQTTQGGAAPLIGVVCALAGAGAYFTAFLRFGVGSRNHLVFAGWGLALGLTASFLILPDALLSVVWSAAAVVAMLAGAARPTLRLHGALYLAAAAVASGLPRAFADAFTGARLIPAGPELWVFALAAVSAYALCGDERAPLRAVPAALAVVAVATLVILSGRPGAAILASSRTLVTCMVALAAGFLHARTGRAELLWISYSAVALGALKLALQDFRQSGPAALAVSLVCYGGLLIVLPRFRR